MSATRPISPRSRPTSPDTTPAAAAIQRAAHDRLGPDGRVRVAVELSEAARAIHIAGLLDRNPGWTRADAVHWFVLNGYGIDLRAER